MFVQKGSTLLPLWGEGEALWKPCTGAGFGGYVGFIVEEISQGRPLACIGYLCKSATLEELHIRYFT